LLLKTRFLRSSVTMKTLISIFLLTAIAPSIVFPQNARQLTPVRGHYKTLASLSKEPTKDRENWNSLRYPTDPKRWEAIQKPKNRTYFLPEDPNLVKVPPPPANSSPQTFAELEYLYQLQLQRTNEDIRASWYFADIAYSTTLPETDSNYGQMQNNLFHIGRSIGTWFTPEKLPKTRLFMSHVWRDATYFIWYYKYKYSRIRPYKLDPRLKNLQETEWEAYPSGHAGNSYVAAFVYQELAPEFTDVFVKDALDMAHSREILGVHYPSDSEASRILARDLVNLLLQNPKFQAELGEAKEEWKSVREKNY
jgi:acid phosphatase (class A)